ncbi:unnamed protein product [Hymenolepis diminuta]|uniref:Uncharacterized protein n=1 Tax=Hymenolepis diminuta TaxID=6216 RepID=A0A0R3SY66_HYMDI|nr:unnamed protein product [Hymenolepis diminuta]
MANAEQQEKTEERVPPEETNDYDTLCQTKEHELVSPLEDVETIQPLPSNHAVQTEIPGTHLQMATKTTPNIAFDKLPTDIPRPTNQQVEYPGRQYTYYQRDQGFEKARELYQKMQLNKGRNDRITDQIYYKRNDLGVTQKAIRNQLGNYSDEVRIPHTKSQTAHGRRRKLHQLPRNKKDPSYVPF